MTDKRRLVVNTVANGTAQVAVMGSALVLMPFLVRAFGLSGYGYYLFAMALVAYAGIMDLGVGASLTRMVSVSTARNDRSEIGRAASTALAFYIGVGLLQAAVLVILAFNAERIAHGSPENGRLLRDLLLVSAVGSLWTWPAQTATFVLAGFQRFTSTVRVSLAATLANAAATVLIILTGGGPVSLAVAGVGISVGAGIASIHLARSQLAGIRVSPRLAQWSIFRAILAFSWSIFVIQVCMVIVTQQTDRVVLGMFVGAAAVALYEGAGKFQGVIGQLSGFANSAILPLASQLHTENRTAVLQALFLRGTRYALAFVAPVVVTLMVLAEPILSSWLGAAFVTQALAAQILISHQLLTAGTTIGDAIIVSRGLLPRRLPNAVGITLGNLALSLLLVRSFGILGVVVGTVVPLFIDYPLHIRFLLKHLEIPARTWAKQVVAPVYPLLVIPLAVSAIGRLALAPDDLVSVAAIALASVVAFWGAFLFAGLSKEERGEVRAALQYVRVWRSGA
ncbi:MAG: oligosaccharide flippase family protein [Thermoleophilia bacterium]